MQRHIAAPPGATPSASALALSLRARRPSAPVATSTKPLTNTYLKEQTHRKSANQDAATMLAAGKEHRRLVIPESTTPRASLFSSQRSRYGTLEECELISSLQQNISALTTLNRREKTQNCALNEKIAELRTECDKLKELYEEEKSKNEKISSLRRQWRSDDYNADGLPHVSNAAATAAALQQQTQLEVSYQRKVLSLENRCRDLMENNKKLLVKIQQLEATEIDAQQQIASLQLENERVGTQVDSLTSTVSSQSALIVGLRKMVSDLTREQQIVNDLTRKLNRCQADLESVKLREKLLRDELDKLRTSMTHEKEALMDKIVELQRQLQQNNQTGGQVQSLEMQITLLRRETATLNETIRMWESKYEQADARMHQQEQMTNRLLQENQVLEDVKADLKAKLSELQGEQEEREHERLSRVNELEKQLREALRLHEDAIATLTAAKDKEIAELMHRIVDLQGELDEQNKAVTELRNEVERLQKEIQSLKQLSQDETVQALQLARQKAASQEALVLVTEEKRVLEEQLRVLEERLAADQAQMQRERDKKIELNDRLDASMLIIQQLENDIATLTEKLEAAESEKSLAEEARAEAEAAKLDAEAARISAETARAEVEARPPSVVVEPPPPVEDVMTIEEKLELKAAISQLKSEYDLVLQQMQELDKEYRKLVTKKYKTESFQNQVQLLQNENSEINLRLEQLCQDLAKERRIVSALSQEMRDLKLRAMDPDLVGKLRKTQEALEKTVSALVEAEAASESTFTCLQCMQPFNGPMTLVPCGHTYCSGCLGTIGDVTAPSTIQCKQCASAKSHETDAVFPNQALADLTARFLFRQQTLASMTTMCLSLRNSFIDRSTVAS